MLLQAIPRLLRFPPQRQRVQNQPRLLVLTGPSQVQGLGAIFDSLLLNLLADFGDLGGGYLALQRVFHTVQ